ILSPFRAFAFLFRSSLLSFFPFLLPFLHAIRVLSKNKPQTNFLPSTPSPELQSFFFSFSLSFSLI
ncbi:hypothetical protein, partial [Aggregatibacter actinomycetemcomitans]